jgi:hypothetical protein
MADPRADRAFERSIHTKALTPHIVELVVESRALTREEVTELLSPEHLANVPSVRRRS